MKRLLSISLLLLFSIQAVAEQWQENPDVAELFKTAEVEGTFVLYDPMAGQLKGYNQSRAETRFVPASTFKIPNTLIGLSVKAVKDVDEVLPYGGKPQPFKTWERDMNLRDAIALSNVTIYKELARRIGLESMKDYVSRLGYGNQDIGTQVDSFWLTGPLKISAVEQVKFLARLAKNELPLEPAIQQVTREIILLEQGEHWKLYGKTGWENAPGPGVGWWVGWVERNGRISTFALNLDVRQTADAEKRIELGKASLKTLGIL